MGSTRERSRAAAAAANSDAAAVARRFTDVIETLEARGRAAPISFGVAQLEEDDSDVQALIARADAALIASRRDAGHESGRT